MIKKLLIVLMILLSLGLVSAAGDLSTISVGYDPVSADGEPGETVKLTVTVTSISDITTVDLVSTDLQTDGFVSSSALGSISDLVAGTPKSTEFDVVIPKKLYGAYTGTITATDTIVSANTIDATYGLTIKQKSAFTITEDTLVLAGEEEETDTGVINIVNDGSTTLAISGVNDVAPSLLTDFTDSDDRVIDLSFSDVTIAPGATGQMTVTAVIPDKMDLDTYSGVVAITESGATDTFDLEVRVQPEVCKDGEIGSEFDIDMDSPDDGDEYAPGETIELELNVANSANKDKDVKVEAFLYDLDEGDKIVDVESDVIEIEEDEDEDFNLELEIPTDSDIDEDHEYVLYVKAYEKGDEDEQCVEEAIDIVIEREDDAMIVSQFLLNPLSVTCGSVVDATITTENIGAKDQDDVTIRLFDLGLGLDETSSPFDVDKASDKDNDYTVRFTFNVPDNADKENYDLEAVVTFDDGDELISEFAKLTVSQCTALPGQATDVVLEVSETDGEVNEGQSISIPVKLTSNEVGSQPYTIGIDGVGWAEAVPVQTLTLDQGQAETVYFYLKTNDDVDEGIYTAVVNVKSGENVIATKTLSFEVKESKGLFSGLGSAFKGTSVFWIIGDILLVIVAVFFIKLIFSGRKGPREVNL